MKAYISIITNSDKISASEQCVEQYVNLGINYIDAEVKPEYAWTDFWFNINDVCQAYITDAHNDNDYNGIHLTLEYKGAVITVIAKKTPELIKALDKRFNE